MINLIAGALSILCILILFWRYATLEKENKELRGCIDRWITDYKELKELNLAMKMRIQELVKKEYNQATTFKGPSKN